MTDDKLDIANKLHKEISGLEDFLRCYLSEYDSLIIAKSKQKYRLFSKSKICNAPKREIKLPDCVVVDIRACVKAKIADLKKEYEAL